MSTVTFNPTTYNGLSFTNIALNEADAGTFSSLSATGGQPVGIVTTTGTGLQWGGGSIGAYYANSSEVLNFTYMVSESSGSLIDSIDQLYLVDELSGPGVSLTAVENVYSTSGTLLGTETFVGGQAAPPPVTLTQAEQTVDVSVTVTMSISSAGTGASGVAVSAFQQSFGMIAAPPATASIGDIVYYDSSGSGLETGFDTGPGIPGVTVELMNGSGTNVLATTTTDASGEYNFSSLAAGVYEVKFIAPTGFGFTTQGVGANPAVNSSPDQTTGITGPITLTAGQADHNVEAGLVVGGSAAGASATIGNTVWLDANGNGFDDGEAGVAGVTVELLNGAGTSVLATTTTDATGGYQFTNLSAGTYEVQFVAPTGDSFTTQNATPIAGQDNSVANASGLTAVITLTAGQVDDNVNAGLTVPNAALGSTVWLDANRDGLLDNGETGVAGVTVELLNSTGTTVLATTTTNSSGTYAFTNLNAGVYEVKFLAPTGDHFTTQGATQAATDSSANVGTGITAPVTLTAGQTDNNVNAGLVNPPAALGSTVWVDTNRDGLLDNGEAGVAGVTVELLNSTGTTVLATTTTNSSGTYAFTNLNAGVYEVKFVAPTGDHFTTQGATQTATDSSANVGTGITAPITLTAGQTDNNVNAGLVKPTASIGDYVWLDLNKNGLQNTGEPGVAGVTVELLNATGTQILATTTTNSSGGYDFTGLNAGVYEVKFVAPSGDTFTQANVGTNGAINSDASQTTGTTAPITLTAGQVDNNVDAGLQQTAGISVLKVPSTMVVNNCGQVTYTFYVTNTGSTALTNVQIEDNIGTASNPDYVKPSLVGSNNGILGAGQTWEYTETVNQIDCTPGSSGSVCSTATGSHLSSGCTAWLSSSFNPTSCANGATYKFQGITCTIDDGGIGSKPITVDCPDSVVTFSSSCKQATTVFDSSTNCWVTTLPANSNPGSVFLSGLPLTIPNGCNLSGSNVTFSIGDASNNCGASSLDWNGTCTGYSSFNQNGSDGTTDYNQIGVKSCDNQSGYGNGGSCDSGYGWNGSGNSGGGSNGNDNGWGSSGNAGNSGWQGSSSDCAGTPENQYTSNNCGNTSNCNDNSSNKGWGNDGSSNNNGWGGNDGSNNSGSCGDGGSSQQNQPGIAGAADTVTVTATTVTSTNQITCGSGGGGTICGTPGGSDLTGGCTAWLSTNFKPTSCANGATYNFSNVKCTISGGGLHSAITESCANAQVVFSSKCTQATTVYNSQTNCWVTTLPANSNPGNVFLTGIPVTVPSGCNFSSATVTWSIGSSSNNCGASTLDCNSASQGYSSFSENGNNGFANYNQIGVKSCDSLSGYGSSGSTDLGCGTRSQASDNDCAGTAENLNTTNNCSTQATGTTVTASDTKEVQVLGNNSNVTVNGTVPTGSLSSLYGTAQTLEFTYTPGNTVSLKQVQSGLAAVTGTNSNTMAFMAITNNANPFASNASIYFEGEVTAGEKIYADATTNVLTNTPIAGGHFSTTAGADIYAYVFTSQQAFESGAAPVQTMAYNTSGSQAMHLGDTIGSLALDGFVGAKGGHLAS